MEDEGSLLQKPIDIWSFGINLYTYLTGTTPYKNTKDEQELKQQIKQIDFQKLDQYTNTGFSPDLVDLL